MNFLEFLAAILKHQDIRKIINFTSYSSLKEQSYHLQIAPAKSVSPPPLATSILLRKITFLLQITRGRSFRKKGEGKKKRATPVSIGDNAAASLYERLLVYRWISPNVTPLRPVSGEFYACTCGIDRYARARRFLPAMKFSLDYRGFARGLCPLPNPAGCLVFNG